MENFQIEKKDTGFVEIKGEISAEEIEKYKNDAAKNISKISSSIIFSIRFISSSVMWSFSVCSSNCH